jgi:hypothetical protein
MWRNISRMTGPVGFAVAIAACGGSTKNGSAGAGGGSGSSSGSSTGGTTGDAGVMCGAQACAPSEVCCYGTGLALPKCGAAGSCTGSSLSCTTKSACSGGQSCCFTYDQGDGGGGAGGAFGLGASFTATCQDSCASTSYSLCSADTDCADGETCATGPYAGFCTSAEGGAGFAFPDGGFALPDGGFTFPRRDASMEPPGEDASMNTNPPPADDGGPDGATQ